MTHTAQEMMVKLGTPAYLKGGSSTLKIAVTIVDARMSYGQVNYRVEPVTGQGTAWVTSASLEFIPGY